MHKILFLFLFLFTNKAIAQKESSCAHVRKVYAQFEEEYNGEDVKWITELKKLKKGFEHCDQHLQTTIDVRLVQLNTNIANYHEALKIGNSALLKIPKDNYSDQCAVYNAFVRCYNRMSDKKMSNYYSKKSIQIARENNMDELELYLVNFAAQLILSKNYEEGIIYLEECQSTASKRKTIDINQTIQVSAFLGHAYSMIGEYPKAISALDTATYYLEKEINPSIEYQLMILGFKTKHFIEVGNYSEALKLNNRFFLLAKKENHIAQQSHAHDNYTNIYEKTNKLPLALSHLRRLSSMKDSLNKVSFQRTTQVIQNNVSLAKKKGDLEILQLKNEMNTLNDQRKSTIVISVSIITVVVLIALLFVFIGKMRLLKLVGLEKSIENKRINTSLEKERFERTKNILQIGLYNTALSDLRKELESKLKDLPPEYSPLFRQTVRKLKRDQVSKIWEEFEVRFSYSHRAFYSNLLKDFPNLTANERKLCAFIRLNLTSKEISAFTGQSSQSIVTARVRLRKKLGIANEKINLVEFISKY